MRAGDLVEVRGAAEILATLDDRGLLRGLPFMPEMIPMLGQRFVVRARVGRACDTIGYTGPRRIPDSVILDDLRCDGGGHDGCGAHCVLYWNEAWLREVGGGAEPEVGHSTGDVEDLRRLVVSSSVDTEAGGPKIYRCQATEFLRASVPEPSWGIASFSRELTSGNVRLLPFLRVLASATYATALTTGSNGLRRGISAVGLSGVTRRVRLAKEARRQPLERTEVRKPSTPDAPATFLEPGQLLKIRPLHEIESQLDERNKTRGLYFDRAEMAPYCGRSTRVLSRVTRFIDEASGEMVELKSDCYVLEGVVCSGVCSSGRWFCPRAISSWWRGSWLTEIETETSSAATSNTGGDR